MKVFFGSFLTLSLLSAVACSTPSSRGRSAGEEYCECSKQEGIFNVSKCKKAVLKEYREDLLDKEFHMGFWDAVADCDE